MAPRKMLVAALAAFTLSPVCVRAALAQDAPATPRVRFAPVSFAPAAYVPLRVALFDAKASDLDRPRGSALMTSLYATTVLVQGLDAHSTLKAISVGATERNPLMHALTSSPPAFVALKAGAAVGLVFAGRRLARHNKVHAAIALIAIDSAYALIAMHNYKVAARLR